MYKGKTILGLIPARGGSKGLPRKNIKPLLGKPLIAWTIEQALASKYLDRVIVSTDDKEIAEISKKYGAEVPFIRPKELARDDSTTSDVILHVLKWFEEAEEKFDYLALLEPTSPLREKDDIDKCIELLINNEAAKSIVSVSKLESAHPEFNIIIDEKSSFIKKIDGSTDFRILKRQDLSSVYFFDGTIYISEVKAFFKKQTFYHNRTLAYIVPRWKSIEVDEIFDLICVEAIIKNIEKIRFNGTVKNNMKEYEN